MNKNQKINILKIRRGLKLEGYAFANFGYSSETDGESQNPHITASGDTSLKEEKKGLRFT